MSLWQAPHALPRSEDAKLYWQKINAIILHITGKAETDLQAAFWEDRRRAIFVGEESMDYWHSIVAHHQSLSREEAIQRLIKAEKIEQKIASIQKTITTIQGDDE